MGRLAKRIEDKRMRRLIRHDLEAGVMSHGVVIERQEGTPHGGPLSPRLANVLLDDVDRELEKRGHAFVRDADDCQVSVRSPKAGERVMAFLRKPYARLHLKINEEKSAVARVITREFLGVAFGRAPGGALRRRVADKALKAMPDRVREITGRRQGRSMGQVVEELRRYLLGWYAYFRLAETPLVFRRLDEWIRHRRGSGISHSGTAVPRSIGSFGRSVRPITSRGLWPWEPHAGGITRPLRSIAC